MRWAAGRHRVTRLGGPRLLLRVPGDGRRARSGGATGEDTGHPASSPRAGGTVTEANPPPCGRAPRGTATGSSAESGTRGGSCTLVLLCRPPRPRPGQGDRQAPAVCPGICTPPTPLRERGLGARLFRYKYSCESEKRRCQPAAPRSPCEGPGPPSLARPQPTFQAKARFQWKMINKGRISASHLRLRPGWGLGAGVTEGPVSRGLGAPERVRGTATSRHRGWGQASRATLQTGPLEGPGVCLPPPAPPSYRRQVLPTSEFRPVSVLRQEPVLQRRVAARSPRPGAKTPHGAPPVPLWSSFPIPSTNSGSVMEPPMSSNPDSSP